MPRGLIECARYAGDMGVTLALQNHKPLIKDHHDVLRMVREVNSPHLKICLDAPLMPDKSAAAMREAAQAVGPLQVMSHFGGEFEPQSGRQHHWRGPNRRTHHWRDEPILSRFRAAMHEIGYNGYTSYELCHQLPVVNGETVGSSSPTRMPSSQRSSCAKLSGQNTQRNRLPGGGGIESRCTMIRQP